MGRAWSDQAGRGRLAGMAMVVVLGLGVQARGNLINGDFEDTPDFVGWTNSGFALAERSPVGPIHYAFAAFDQQQSGAASLSQSFVLPSDTPWLGLDLSLSLVVCGCGEDPPDYVEAIADLPDGSMLSLWRLGGGDYQGDLFWRYWYDLSDYAGQTITLRFELLSTVNNSGRIKVDRIVLAETPEPTSGALLSMVGAALLAWPARRGGRPGPR